MQTKKKLLYVTKFFDDRDPVCVYTLPTRKNLLQKKIPPTFCANFNKTKTTNILSIVLIYNFPIQKKKKTDDISTRQKSQRHLCIARSVI